MGYLVLLILLCYLSYYLVTQKKQPEANKKTYKNLLLYIYKKSAMYQKTIMTQLYIIERYVTCTLKQNRDINKRLKNKRRTRKDKNNHRATRTITE